jgi:hypothetical protein
MLCAPEFGLQYKANREKPRRNAHGLARNSTANLMPESRWTYLYEGVNALACSILLPAQPRPSTRIHLFRLEWQQGVSRPGMRAGVFPSLGAVRMQ